nr:hypothetical protein [Altererythrobacter segetis]
MTKATAEVANLFNAKLGSVGNGVVRATAPVGEVRVFRTLAV